jgi:hypothetical protein
VERCIAVREVRVEFASGVIAVMGVDAFPHRGRSHRP